MSKRNVVRLLVLFLVTGATSLRVQGQVVQGQEPKPASANQAQSSNHVYRLDYALSETEGGKQIDTRRYQVTVGGADQSLFMQGRVEIGTRVPTGAKTDGTVQYLDVGTSIMSVLRSHNDLLDLNTNCSVTSVAPDDAKVGGQPLLRTLTIANDTPLVVGKAVLVGTADDPNSNREFQLEVTVTELK